MGLIDEALKSKDEKSKEAYGRGVKDADDASIVGHVAHGIGDFGAKFIPKWESTESKSYEAGYHDRFNDRVKRKSRRGKKSSPTYTGYSCSSSSSDSSGVFGAIFGAILLVVVGGGALLLAIGVIWFFVALNQSFEPHTTSTPTQTV